ncbi:hypothetical protein Dimus_014756 [Dionaea muscipula]
MFTPRRRAPSFPASSTPRTETETVTAFRSPTAAEKGKAVAYVDGPPAPEPAPPPPPLISLDEGRVGRPVAVAVAGYDVGNSEDWRRFKEAGLLDAEVLERKDRDALHMKISRLRRQLLDYQYNMGLLLMEKNDVNSKCDELMQGVAEAQEILKREQAANLISITEAEKRQENMRRALDHEKKRVLDLEKTLHEMCEDCEQLKAGSERAIADADANRDKMEAKAREVEGKLYSANSKHAEADRKLSKLERHMQELEDRENILKSERLSLTVEKEAHEDTFRKQKEDLMEWERKLQRLEERHCNHRSILNEREEKLNEFEETYKRKENEIEQLEKNIDSANLALKDMENGISNRLRELILKEEKIDASRRNLELREKQILVLEQRLCSKERVEIQNMLDKHRTLLDTKMQEFELHLQQKKNIVDEEFRTKYQAVEQKEIEIRHLEAKLKKREEAVEKKLENIKVKEEELESKMKTFMEKDQHIESEEKELEVMRKQMLAEKETLQVLTDDIQRLLAEIKEKEMQIHEEREKLKLAREKRTEYLRLRTDLTQEMRTWKHQNELVLKKIEDLKQDKLKFDKDRKVLNEKKTIVDDELERIEEERLGLKKFQSSEEQRLKEEKIKMEEKIAQEMEVVRLEKESFGAKMKHDLLVLAEKAQNDHIQMVQHFELRRRELEENMCKKQEELEERVHQKERVHEEERLGRIRNTNLLKEVAEKRKKEMESCRLQMETEKRELALNMKMLEKDQLEIQKDISTVCILSTKLKEEREKLLNERSSFLALVEKVKSCMACGDFTRDFVFPDLLIVNDDDFHPFIGLDENILNTSEDLGKNERSPAPMHVRSPDAGRLSLLQKCTSSVRNWFPQKRVGDTSDVGISPHYDLDSLGNEKCATFPMTSISDQGETRAQLSVNIGPGPSPEIADHSDVQNVQLNNIMGKAQSQDSPSVNNLSHAFSELQEVPDDSQLSELQSVWGKPGGKRKAGIHRTRSVKAVVEDAKSIIGEPSKSKELKVDKQRIDSVCTGGEGSESLSQSDKVVGPVGRKRPRARVTRSIESEQNIDDSETCIDSNAGGRSKRRQTMLLASQPPVETRYNLRQRKASSSVTTVQNLANQTKDDKLAGDDNGGAKQTEPGAGNAPSPTYVTAGHGDRNLSMQILITEDIKLSSDAKAGLSTTSKTVNGNINAATVVENGLLNRHVHPETVHDEEDEGSLLGNDKGSDDGDERDLEFDDEEQVDPGQFSVGKQIWNFFTS